MKQMWRARLSLFAILLFSVFMALPAKADNYATRVDGFLNDIRWAVGI